MRIRRFRATDYDDVLRLYRAQTRSLPYHHNVRKDQFKQELFTSCFIRDPAHHLAKARIALVATERDRIRAFVSGGLVTRGDEVTESLTGYVQSIIGERDSASAVEEMIGRVVLHIRQFDPIKIVAQDSCLSPVFSFDSASSLSSSCPWIGQCLLDSGFKISSRALRMVALLDQPRPSGDAPPPFKFLHLTHEMSGFESKYDFGCVLLKPPYGREDGIVWCGNFYSGCFVKGSAFRSLYINWFTIMDDAYKGKGLGRAMLRHVLHEAQKHGAEYVSLLTHDENFVAQNLYLSEGFKVVDTTQTFELPSSA